MMVRWLIACTLVALSTGCGADRPRPPSAAETTGSTTTAATTIRVGGKPCGVVVADAKVWVSNFDDDTVQWIDPATGKASAPVGVGSQPCGLAVGAGSLWVENFGSGDVTRLDQATGKVQATVKVGGQPYDVAFSTGAAWVTDWADGTVSRIDATTNQRSVVTVGGQPTGIAPSAGKLWVALGTADSVLSIDARSRKVEKRIALPSAATWTAYDDKAVWISMRDSGDVVRIDTSTGTVVATMHLDGVPQDGAVLGDDVWVPTKSGEVFRLGIGDNAVSGPWPTGVTNPFVLAGDAGTLWLPDFAGSDVTRLPVSSLR
jgi:YVTN family beta-propeller protein